MIKKLIVLSVFIAICGNAADAVRVVNLINGLEIEKESCEEPVIVWESTEDGYVLTFSMGEISVCPDDLYPSCKKVSIPNFGHTVEKGTPLIPVKGFSMVAPYGKKCRIEKVECDSALVKMAISPSRPALLSEYNAGYSLENVPPIIRYDGFSNSPISLNEEGYYYRGEYNQILMLHPVSYNMTTGEACFWKHVKCTVGFVEDEATEIADIEKMSPFYQDKSSSSRSVERTDDSRDILIITAPEFTSSLSEFIKWKRHEGYHCTVMEYEFGVRPARIKADIIDFAEENKSLYGLIIVGDLWYIPAYWAPVSDDIITNYPNDALRPSHCSDVYYGCLDYADDYFPDIVVGRLPANNLEELEAMLYKIMHYEKCDSNMPVSSYPARRCLHIGVFEPKKFNNMIEKQNVISTHENLISALNGYDVTRVYRRYDETYPKYYDDNTEMPDWLQYPNYAWDGSANDIINSINQGVGYVLYYGHGDMQTWQKPYFGMDDVKRLNNYDWFPPVYSMACSTCSFDFLSLCGELMSVQNKGASAAYGASNLSFFPVNGFMAEGLISASHISGLSDGNSPISNCVMTIGDCIREGINNMVSKFWWEDEIIKYQASTYNLLGDPTMRIHANSPVLIDNVALSVIGNILKVQTQNECQITCITKNDEMESYVGSEAMFSASNSRLLVLTGRNIRPTYISLTYSEHNEEGCYRYNRLKYATKVGNNVVVNYDLVKYETALVAVYTDNGVLIDSSTCDTENYRTVLNVTSSLPTKYYIVALHVDGKVVGQVKLSK